LDHDLVADLDAEQLSRVNCECFSLVVDKLHGGSRRVRGPLFAKRTVVGVVLASVLFMNRMANLTGMRPNEEFYTMGR